MQKKFQPYRLAACAIPWLHGIKIYIFIVIVEILRSMGYAREQLEESLSMHRYDDVFATYQLLGLRPATVWILFHKVTSSEGCMWGNFVHTEPNILKC